MIRRLLAALRRPSCAASRSSSCKSSGGATHPQTVDGFPAYVTTNDEKGAQNFARYWIDTLNKATTSGDTKKLKKLQKASCTTCADFAKQLDDIYASRRARRDRRLQGQEDRERGRASRRRAPASAWC